MSRSASPASSIDDVEDGRGQRPGLQDQSVVVRRDANGSTPSAVASSPQNKKRIRPSNGTGMRKRNKKDESNTFDPYAETFAAANDSVLATDDDTALGTPTPAPQNPSLHRVKAKGRKASSVHSASASVDPETAKEKEKGTAVGTRRQANGTVGSVYSGSKVRHIKKPDGIPLWRREIQHLFLHLVITDDTKCFTMISAPEEGPVYSFADIYIDCLARSSKTSRVLKERLQVDRPAAENMAMICLLVNIGRMNTTLNFFPEMRAQLRTYHPIPSLQAYQSQKDYKSLQDAPRLKSILKGASEDIDQPRTLSALREAPIPRTNPVNLIFVLSQMANEISQQHFTDRIDFFDLAIRPTISSASRAKAFLWLMWWYLESDFDKSSALRNPFGSGEYTPEQDPESPTDAPLLVPALQHITEEEGDAENVDQQEEKDFGVKMTAERERFNAEFAAEEELAKLNGATDDRRTAEHRNIKKLKLAEQARRESGDFVDDSEGDTTSVARASPAVRPKREETDRDSKFSVLHHDSLDGEGSGTETERGQGDLGLGFTLAGKPRQRRARGSNKGTPSRNRSKKPSNGDAGEVGSVRGRGSKLASGPAREDTPDTGRGTPLPSGPQRIQFDAYISKAEARDSDLPPARQALPPGQGHHPILSRYDNLHGQEPHLIPGLSINTSSKSRARTNIQREREELKIRRISWLIHKKRRELLRESRQARKEREEHAYDAQPPERDDFDVVNGGPVQPPERSYSFFLEAAKRIADLPVTYDSDDDPEANHGLNILRIQENRGTGLGGIIPKAKRQDNAHTTISSIGNASNGDDMRFKYDRETMNGTPVEPKLEHRHDKDPSASQQELDEDLDDGEADYWYRIMQRTRRRLLTWSGDRDYNDLMRSRQLKQAKKLNGHNRNPPSQPPRQPPRTGKVVRKIASRPATAQTQVLSSPAKGIGGKKERHIIHPNSSRPTTANVEELNEEITMDLLAERSDEERDGDEDVEDVEMG